MPTDLGQLIFVNAIVAGSVLGILTNVFFGRRAVTVGSVRAAEVPVPRERRVRAYEVPKSDTPKSHADRRGRGGSCTSTDNAVSCGGSTNGVDSFRGKPGVITSGEPSDI